MQRLWFYWNYHVTKTEMVNISQSIPQQHTFFSKENVNLAAVSMFALIWKKKIAKTSTTISCFPKWKIAPPFLQDVRTFYFGLLSLQSTMSFEFGHPISPPKSPIMKESKKKIIINDVWMLFIDVV